MKIVASLRDTADSSAPDCPSRSLSGTLPSGPGTSGGPLVSVVMPARNVAPFVDAAVESILAQDFQDFEFIIRDDGSTDGTWEHLLSWSRRDTRIRLFQGPQLGLAESSNWVVHQARAPLIARMDADDVARADRLGRQVQVLQEDPSVVLAGSLCDLIDAAGRRVRGPDRWRIVRRSWFAPFAHASVMFRRSAFDQIGGYRVLSYCEDWDLFLRFANHGRVVVIADPVISHRIVHSSFSGVPANRATMQDSIDRILRALPPYGTGQAYQPISPEPERSLAERRVDPIAIISSGSTLLWSGGSPKILEELLCHGRLRFDLKSLAALGWAVLARISPASLRLALKALCGTRNVAVWPMVRGGCIYEWNPSGAGKTAPASGSAFIPAGSHAHPAVASGVAGDA